MSNSLPTDCSPQVLMSMKLECRILGGMFPSPRGIFPGPGTKPGLLHAGRFLPLRPPREESSLVRIHMLCRYIVYCGGVCMVQAELPESALGRTGNLVKTEEPVLSF